MPLPVPEDEPVLVGMQGFGFTQYRLVHDITRADYESLRVPVYAPATGFTVADDAGLDNARPSEDLL
jgi:hypothetical protein